MKNNIIQIYNGVKRALNILTSPREKIMVIILWVSSLMNYLITMIGPIIQQWIADGAASLLTDAPQHLLLVKGFILLVFSALLSFFIRAKSRSWSGHIEDMIADSVAGDIITKAAHIKYKYFEDSKTYEQLANIYKNVPRKLAVMITWRVVPPLVGGGVSLIFSFAVLCRVSLLVAILIAAGNVLSIVFYYMRMKDNYYLKREQIPQMRWAESYWNTIVGRDSIKEVKAFGILKFLENKWKEFSLKSSRENFRFAVKYSCRLLLADICHVGFKVIALCYVCYLIIIGQAQVGAFLLVYGYFSTFSMYLSDISNAFINIGENAIYIDDWMKFMKLEEDECTVLPDAEDLHIQIKNLRFKYPNSETEVLAGINLDIEKGEHIAVVGTNGSGKSTFISLLNGFYDNFEGEILLNGMDIRKQTENVRRKFACVFQEFGKYEFSIRDNVKLGDLYNEITEEDILKTLEKTKLSEFVSNLPEGIQTNLGTYERGGVNLSGGQWQKIAISRALLRKDASLVILDEPTAALDPCAETLIYEEFLNMNRDKACILVSHRLGATKYADKILVFDNGKIAETGTHKELMDKRGLYFEMYTAQAKWYA